MTVAVIGTGSIGAAFAVVFAAAGAPVRCWDPQPTSRDRAAEDVAHRLGRLHGHGLLDGEPEKVLELVTFHAELDDAVAGAVLVQECAPERLALKRELYTELGRLTGPEVVLASSSSAIPASAIADGLAVADRLLVAHPANPPYLLPLVEIAPAPTTAPTVVHRAMALYLAAGLQPIRLHHEVEGFVFNRLQGALLREAYCLLRDGVADVEDIDAVVRLGLGRRWSVIGPFETVDLNTRGGIEVHAASMGPAYERMGAERGQHDPWTPDLVARATAQRRALLRLEDWAERVRWRDERLMELLAQDRGREPEAS